MPGDDNTPPPTPPPTSADKLIPFSITNKKKKPHLLPLIWSGANLMISSRCGFLDPYDARAVNLGNGLRSIKIGKMFINEYWTKIKSMADRLKNLGCIVSEKNLVIYVVNGLNSCFATLVEIIRHREPLPTFETAWNMLLLKESSMNDQAGASTTFESSSSSLTILVATNSSDNKDNPNSHSTKSQSLPQLCNHFNKGTCKFGDRRKFIHDHCNTIGLNSKLNSGTPSFVGRHTIVYNTHQTIS
ncbi:hybrid signal transduction histidine kinase M [Tanacetum coccineum]